MDIHELGLISQAIESMINLTEKLERSLEKNNAEDIKKQKEEILKMQYEIEKVLNGS